MKTRRVYKFGSFCLDATARVLLKDGEPVRLARKAVETLLVLAENSGQVVTKEELMSALWPDRVVDEANLAQNVAVVRKALHLDRGGPGTIETFPGRGYRIVGPVTMTEEPAEHPPAASARPWWRRPLYVGPAAAAVVALAGLALPWTLRRAAPPPPREPSSHRVPVTRLAGKEYQPAISPDGTRVAFVWEPQGPRSASIWVREAGETSPRRITPPDCIYSSPAWSPDGRRLAYLRFREAAGALVVAEAGGGNERVVATVFPSRYGLANRHLDWSPDGSLLAVDDAESGHQAFGIFLVSLATGEKKRLTQPPEDNIIGDVDPRFSPDGKTVSFVRAFHRAFQELFVAPVAGGAPRQLTSDARQVSGQDWTPDGRALVFGSDRSGEFRLWKAAFGADGRAVLEATAVYGDSPIQLSLARKAPALVYSVLQNDLNIWRLDLAPAGKAERWTRIVASSGQDASPQYSPAGNRISFRSDRSGEEQLWVSDQDGGNPVQVTQGAQRPSVGRWSPDGRSIVFNNPRTTEIFIASEGPGGAWAVRSVGNGIHPVFSPDGQWIYAGRTDSIVRLPAEGGRESVITRTQGISLGVSGDGLYIYFVREPSASSLWRVEVASGRLSKVLDGLVPYCTSCWALASGGLYYLGTKPGAADRQTLYFRDFASGRDRALVDYPEPLSPIGSGPFSLSPEGRYLLCVRLDPSNSDVFRVEPFR